MKKEKGQFLLIKGTVYPFDTLVTTADHDAVCAYIEKRGYVLDASEREQLEMGGVGRTVMLRGGQTIIRLEPAKTKIGIDVADLAHEIAHAAHFLFDRIGIKHSHDSDEAYAYYQAYLMREVLAFFD